MLHRELLSVLFLLLLQLFSCSSRIQQAPKTEQDASFQNFMRSAMGDYTPWLLQHDPLPEIADSINLASYVTKGDRLNANFSVANQYMEGFSQPNNVDVTPNSDLNEKVFGITLTTAYDDYFTFGGDYSVNGTISVGASDSKPISFSGNGKWRLKAKDRFEFMQIIQYNVTAEGYVDLNNALRARSYYYVLTMDWLELEFEGIQLQGQRGIKQNNEWEDTARADELNEIKQVLALVYKRFLTTSLTSQYPVEVIPQQQLLASYFKEIFSKTKYSDIISLWLPPPASSSPGYIRAYSLVYFGFIALISVMVKVVVCV